MEPAPLTEPESKPKPRARTPKKPEKQRLSFNIPEKLLILSIDDDKGTLAVPEKSALGFGLAGALLAELALSNKIQLQGGRLVLSDPTPAGEAVLDETLLEISAEKKPRKLSRWIDTIGSKRVIRRVAEILAERNVIRIEKKRYLWIIPYEIYPQVDASAKYWIKQHLRSVVLAGEKAEAPDVALLSLLKACDMLRLLFTRDERKYASKKVDDFVRGEVFGEAVAELLAEIEAAAVVAVVVATSASS